MNDAYEMETYGPGLFLFGSDGGGEALAFDMRAEGRPIVSVPFIGMDRSLIRVMGSSFTAFLESLHAS